FGFRDFYPGGVLHTFPYLLDVFSTVHEARGVPEPLLPEQEELWKAAMANPDFKMYQNLFNILTQKGQRTFIMFLSMIAPWETEDAIETAEARFRKIKIPVYTGSGAYAYTYKLHWLGAQNYFRNIDAPKKLLFAGPAHLERPFHQLHDEIIRWYDHWLKGIDNGIMHEEPVRYWLMGANEWRTAADWPLPDTKWVKFYLCDWGRLSEDEPVAAELAGAAALEPDVFTQMPLKKTTKVERLRYMTDPLHNRLDLQFSHCLRDAVHEASSSDIRALVISSEGEDFSFGGEVREWPGKNFDWFRTFVAEVNASYRALEILRVPTVAAVRGAAFGGGFELALSCDFLVAADNGVFRCVEVTTGFIPSAGALQRLAERVGRSRASRFAMLGEPISGALAGNLGIATHVVPNSMVEGTAVELAATLANGPTRAYPAVGTLLKPWSAV